VSEGTPGITTTDLPVTAPGDATTHAAQEIVALDRLVHEPARLAVLAVLYGAETVDFNFLQTATGLTGGNLSRQASKLEEAGYLAIRKYFRGRIPATSYCLTPAGRAAFAVYWEQLTAIGRRVGAVPGTSGTGKEGR